MSDWWVGDIVLFAAHDGISRVIATLQAPWGGDAAQWTHAAMYVGNGRIVEAAAHPHWQVMTRVLEATDRLLVRLHDARLSPEQRHALAKGALETDAAYDWANALRTGLDAFVTGPHPELSDRRSRSYYRAQRHKDVRITPNAKPKVIDRCICSSFLDAVYGEYTGYVLAPHARRLVPPAAIYANDRLMRHHVTHCRVPAHVLLLP